MPELMRDPVCGMDIGVGEAVGIAVTEGRWFSFCCPRCHAAFLDTPHSYVGWPEDPIRPLAAPVAIGVPSSPEPCRLSS